jgi:hypothetical protein
MIRSTALLKPMPGSSPLFVLSAKVQLDDGIFVSLTLTRIN